MTGTLVLWLALAAGQATAEAPTPVTAPEAAPPALKPFRTGRELRDAARDALRRWAKPSDDDCTPAAREFLVLYQELQADRAVPAGQRELLAGKIRLRLHALSKEIVYQAAVEERLARQTKPAKIKLPEAQADNLGQFAGGQRAGFGGPAGRPAGVGAGVQGGMYPQGIPDGGKELVDLIQHVIAPQSWDVNGGPGSIYYWAPGHAIVVRQTAEVHHQLGDTLHQLRRAGN